MFDVIDVFVSFHELAKQTAHTHCLFISNWYGCCPFFFVFAVACFIASTKVYNWPVLWNHNDDHFVICVNRTLSTYVIYSAKKFVWSSFFFSLSLLLLLLLLAFVVFRIACLVQTSIRGNRSRRCCFCNFGSFSNAKIY